MDHWSRVERALSDEPLSEPLVALWRHFPEDDQTPQRLVARTLDWQNRWNFDVVKFMPSGTYGVEDWGAISAYRDSPIGTREVVRTGIRHLEDWGKLKALDTRSGTLGWQNQALGAVAKELQGRVPILQTVFSPLTTARKLAGDRIFADIRNAPGLMEEALMIITDVTIRFCQDAIDRGAGGIFFATQLASHRLLTLGEHERFGRAYDLAVLESIQEKSRFNMLHVHGLDTMFEQVCSYPVHAINWHDRLTAPTLAQARRMFSGLLAGGLNECETMVNGNLDAIDGEVRCAIDQCPDGRLMIAPGCVLPTATADTSIEAVLRAAGRLWP